MALKIRFKKGIKTERAEVTDGDYSRVFEKKHEPFDLDPDWAEAEKDIFSRNQILEIFDSDEKEAKAGDPKGEAKAKPKTNG